MEFWEAKEKQGWKLHNWVTVSLCSPNFIFAERAFSSVCVCVCAEGNKYAQFADVFHTWSADRIIGGIYHNLQCCTGPQWTGLLELLLCLYIQRIKITTKKKRKLVNPYKIVAQISLTLWLGIQTALAISSFHLTSFIIDPSVTQGVWSDFFVTNEGVDQASDTVFQTRECNWVEP